MKILVGYDGSNASRNALALVRKYAKLFQSEIHILTSIPEGQIPIEPESLPQKIEKAYQMKSGSEGAEIENKLESILESAQKELAQGGIKSETHLLNRGAQPGEDIVDYAKEINADFIVVGIGKTSRVGKLFFGSNAQYVILESSCPVITVK